MQIGVSVGDDVTDEEEFPSQRTETTDDEDSEENDQELGSVDNNTTIIENLQMKEKDIQLLKLMWGEFLDALGQSNLSRIS